MIAYEAIDSWCCSLFSDKVNQRDERGSSIQIVESSDVLGFLLSWQVADSSHLAELKLDTAFPVSLAETQGILFCPWCGKNLREFYQRPQ